MKERQGFSRRKLIASTLVLGTAGSTGRAEVGAVLDHAKLTTHGLKFTGPDSHLLLIFGEDSVSVIRHGSGFTDNAAGFFTTQSVNAQLETKSHGWRVVSGSWWVEVARRTGALAVYRNADLVMTDRGGGLSRQVFQLSKETDLYGLGQFRDPLINYRDRSVYLGHGNMDAVNPTIVSPDGWGLIWDTGTHAHMTSEGAKLTFDTPEGVLVRYHLLAGAGIDEVIGAYRRVTGKAPLLGKYAYGFWQSQERYRSQDELTAIVDGYRARKLPLDIIVQDWRYWGENNVFSGMVWDKAAFPDPKGMVGHVHKHNAHIIASVWPAFGPDGAIYKDLDREGLLLKGAHWSGGRVLDITSKKARAIYWRHIQDGLMSVGLDGLWTDGCEPEFMSTGSRYVTTRSYIQNGQSAAGPIRDHLLTFSYYQARDLYLNMRRTRPDRRPLILTRSVYAGQQAFNTVTWSGDIFAGWETFKNQVIASQQITLSGIPYWTVDIGAFLVTHRFEGGLKNPAYRELYVRWFQWGAFLPVMRAHGTEIRRELWAMQDADGGNDPVSYDALVQTLKQRYALMPYIYSQAAKVTLGDETFLRPLVMDFASDARAQTFPYQYMFGHDLLVVPVVTPLTHTPENRYEFIPNWAVTGLDGPAAEVEFYEGANFERSVDKRLTDDLKMSWSGDVPAELTGKPYSARWKGRIIATETGLHRFSVITQGLIRFSLDGDLKVYSAGADDGVSSKADGAVSFKGHKGDDTYLFEMQMRAGQAYVFELTQSQPKPDVVSLWVEWETPSIRAAMQTSPDKTLEVYLPKGQDWYAFGTAKKLTGGQVIRLRPAINVQPLFVRAGAIIPQTPDIQYADAPVEETEVHIYAGRNGAFTLYDDAGDGHGYEHGEHSLIKLTWDEASARLTIGPVSGGYPGMVSARRFKAILYRDGETAVKTATSAAMTATHITF